jgi:hypothetical protein
VPRGDQSLIVRGVGLVRTLDDLGNIVVTQRNSVPYERKLPGQPRGTSWLELRIERVVC